MPIRLEIEPHRLLPATQFELIEARIDWGNGQTSRGWGRDPLASRATDKAVCEAIERYCQRCLPAARFCPMSDLPTCIDPLSLVRNADWQFRGDGRSPGRFDPGETRYWLPASPVRNGGCTWVIADCVCSPAAFDEAYRKRLITHSTTSGCASAFSLDTAIVRAALELVERDAMMRHWFAQSCGIAVSPSSLPGDLSGRVTRLQDAGCTVGVQLLTRAAYPAWLVWARSEARHFVSTGSASGLDPEESLGTALRELETQALARLEGVPEASLRPEHVRSAADHAAIYGSRHYFRTADAFLRNSEATAPFSYLAGMFSSAADALYDRLEGAGHTLYWVDLTVDAVRGSFGGGTVHTVRAVGTELIPLSFGQVHSPLGMDQWQRIDPAALHPFA